MIPFRYATTSATSKRTARHNLTLPGSGRDKTLKRFGPVRSLTRPLRAVQHRVQKPAWETPLKPKFSEQNAARKPTFLPGVEGLENQGVSQKSFAIFFISTHIYFVRLRCFDGTGAASGGVINTQRTPPQRSLRVQQDFQPPLATKSTTTSTNNASPSSASGQPPDARVRPCNPTVPMVAPISRRRRFGLIYWC